MKWKMDSYGIWRLCSLELTEYIMHDLRGVQAKEENLAVVAPQPDGKTFWRVFEDLAWRLPNEPALTLLDLEREGYALTADEAKAICENVISEIVRRGQRDNDRLVLAERQTRELLRLVRIILLAWGIAVLLAIWLILATGAVR